MPLHRDIHWLGRQWTVTGHGLQLINQKQMGYYDIEVARLWEPGVIEAMRSKAWINRDDFDKAVEVARIRFSQTKPVGAPLVRSAPPAPPPERSIPVEPPAVPTVEDLLARLKSRSSAVGPAKPVEARLVAPLKDERHAAEPAKQAPPASEPLKTVPPPPATPASLPADRLFSAQPRPTWPAFDFKMAASARLVRTWRVRLTLRHGNLPGLPPRG